MGLGFKKPDPNPRIAIPTVRLQCPLFNLCINKLAVGYLDFQIASQRFRISIPHGNMEKPGPRSQIVVKECPLLPRKMAWPFESGERILGTHLWDSRALWLGLEENFFLFITSVAIYYKFIHQMNQSIITNQQIKWQTNYEINHHYSCWSV